MKLLKKIFFVFLLNINCYISAFQIEIIQANKIDEITWHKLKDLFVTVFARAYNHVDIKDINSNFNSKENYLQNLFDTDRKYIDNLDFDFILATTKQEIIGYILSCHCDKDRKIYIHHLVVDSSKHNNGIGKSLIKTCENFYKETDLVCLSTRIFNYKAIGFYKHIGFYETENMPQVAYIIRPNAKNNPQIVNLEKKL